MKSPTNAASLQGLSVPRREHHPDRTIVRDLASTCASIGGKRDNDPPRQGENEPGNARRCTSRTLLQRSSSRSVPMGSLQAGAVPRAPVGRGLQELDERVADDGDAEGR